MVIACSVANNYGITYHLCFFTFLAWFDGKPYSKKNVGNMQEACIKTFVQLQLKILMNVYFSVVQG